MEMLQETVAEMARNGCRKIMIVSGHGGNTSLVGYFLQTQLDAPKDYIVYAIGGGSSGGGANKPGLDGHAGEGEISTVMASRPELVHVDRAGEESGKDLKRLDLPAGVTTGIGWYASFPNHYQGDAAGATAQRGETLVEGRVAYIADAIRAIKADQAGPRLQAEFFEAAKHPLTTRQ